MSRRRRRPLSCRGAAAQAQISVKLGVLNDRSGLYSDIGGEGSVVGGPHGGRGFQGRRSRASRSRSSSADHQNKPDVGSNIARQWYDQDGVDVILDVPTSSVALAINQITREKNKIFLNSGAASSDLTGPQCSPNTIHWAYDTGPARERARRRDGASRAATPGSSSPPTTPSATRSSATPRRSSQKNGGKVLGGVKTPFPANDFSSFLLQAQASKAKVIGLANAGGDTINSIKQAAEFGITQGGQNLAGLLVFVNDVKALGLKTAQGLVFTETFYWDANDATRAWSKRFMASG